MVSVLIAAALASASLPPVAAAAPAPADARPAIWVVNDRDTVIFLFGTFHALDGRSNWFNDEVETAFQSADELILETIVPEAVAPPAVQSRHQVRRLPVAPSASFLASTRLAVSAGRAKGMQVDLGADEILRRAARAAGKPVRGLEPFEHQLAMFSRLPAAPARSTLVGNILSVQRMSTMMSHMQAAWNRGDHQVFARVVGQLRESSPETYRMMFTDRNVLWAEWIANRLERPGTVFVAVGAGHLAGADSVQAKLAAIGVPSNRIN